MIKYGTVGIYICKVCISAILMQNKLMNVPDVRHSHSYLTFFFVVPLSLLKEGPDIFS